MLRPTACPSPILLAIAVAIAGISGASAADDGDGNPPSMATRIAAAVIAERAREQAIAGGGPIAAQLDALARALAAGQVSLNDAALVMHIAMAGAMAPPRPLSANAAPVTPAQVVAILDGAAPPAAAAPAPAVAPAPVPVGTPPVPPPAGTPVGQAVASVLAVGRGGDGKSSLVMVSAGSDKHLVKGQRLLVLRQDKLVAQLGISDLRDTMAVCVILAPSSGAETEIKEGDTVYLSGE